MLKSVKFLGAVTIAAVLAGCGQGLSPASADMVISQRQHLAKASNTASVAKVNKQESVIQIAAPAEFEGNGAIAMTFKFPEKEGYSVMATANDIAKIVVTLKTRSFLLTKTVGTVEVLKSQVVNNRAAVQFTGLEAGSYTVEIVASSAANANIGSSTESVTVTAGQTATVNSKLQLVGGGTTTTPAGTALGVNIEVVNGQ